MLKIIFGVDNSSSSHADNHKNNFGVPEKGLVVILVKQTQSFAWIDITMEIIVTFLLKGTFFQFKANDGSITFSTRFSFRHISDWFGTTESREV